MSINSQPYQPPFVGPAITPANGYVIGSLSKLSDGFDAGVTNLNSQLQAAIAAVQANPSDPKALADLQAAEQDYTNYREAQSGMVKAMKTADSAIIQNF